MKKKIKDLTLKEAQTICLKRGMGGCQKCPLYEICQCSFDYNNEDLDKEIEVEE